MTRAAPPSVFKPYAAERTLDLSSVQVAFCERCPKLGRRTELVFGTDAIGRTTTRCPACDGVAPRRPANPNEVLRPQALIAESQLLPPCPPGVLRCQGCARPVEGDARLCQRCEMPALRAVQRNVVSVQATLTPPQARMLRTIVEVIDATGQAPTLVELKRITGAGQGTVAHHVEKLERKGYIQREAGKAHSIVVLIREPVLKT